MQHRQKYAFGCGSMQVQVFTPFDFLYYYPHYRLDEKTLILGISQTARSIGTIHCLEKGREYGGLKRCYGNSRA